MTNENLQIAGTQPRAAIYSRYSSDMQRPASLEDQERNCRSLAAEKGWIVLDGYVRGDKAMTGKMGKNRPALNFLIDAVQRKPRPIDVLIVDELSRLGRKLKNILELSDILKHYGVKLYIVAQKLDSDDPNFSTLVTLHGMVDEQNSERTRHRVLRGQEGRVREGYSSGSRCFGYRSVQDIDSNGSLQGRAALRGVRWEIIEEQAKTIRCIHQMYADGMSDYLIAMRLNDEGVPAARKPKYGPDRTVWNANLVKRILTNKRYVGKIVWNRTTQAINPITEKIDTRKNSSDKWVEVDAPHLRIVSDEDVYTLFECDERLQESPDRNVRQFVPSNLRNLRLRGADFSGGFALAHSTRINEVIESRCQGRF
jgi:site-specific DNA recombinase